MPGPLDAPVRWESREALKRMVEGAQRKARRCERDGDLCVRDAGRIARALRAVLVEIERVKWRQPCSGPSTLEVEPPLGEVRPLPTEGENSRC